MATESPLAAIQDAIHVAKQCAAQTDLASFLRASRDFHRLVGEAAGNLPLADFVVRNEERTDMYLLNYGKVVEQDRMMASIHEHQSILEALQHRDPEAAERRVIYHAQSLRDRFTELFNVDSSSADDDEERL